MNKVTTQCSDPKKENPVSLILVFDLWEKFNVLLQEILFLELNVKAHMPRSTERTEIGDLLLTAEQQKYNDILLGLRSRRRKAVHSIHDFLSWYAGMKDGNRFAESSFYFDFVARRNCLLEQANSLTQTLGKYAQTASQTRKFSFSFLESSSTPRRFNFKAFDQFSSEYVRMQKYMVLDLVDKLFSKHRGGTALSDTDRNDLASMRVSLHWDHITTTTFNYFVTETPRVEGASPASGHLVLNMPYWFLDLPSYLPVVAHEMAHVMVEQVKARRTNNYGSRMDDFLQKLNNQIYYFLLGAGLGDMAESLTDTLVQEFVSDAIGIVLHGSAYLLPLFTDTVGMGLSSMFRETSGKSACTDEHELPVRPKIEAYPWLARIRIATRLLLNLHSDPFSKEVGHSILDFLEKYEEASRNKYASFRPLRVENANILSFHKQCADLVSSLFERRFLPIVRNLRWNHRTAIDSHLAKALRKHTRKYRNTYWPCEEGKSRTEFNMKRTEDLSMLSIWETASRFLECEIQTDFSKFMDKLAHLPGGKRLVMVAVEDFFLRGATTFEWMKCIKNALQDIGDTEIANIKKTIRELKSNKKTKKWEKATQAISRNYPKSLKRSHHGEKNNRHIFDITITNGTKTRIWWTLWNECLDEFFGEKIRQEFLDTITQSGNNQMIDSWLLTYYKAPKPMTSKSMVETVTELNSQNGGIRGGIFLLCSSYDFASLEKHDKTFPLGFFKEKGTEEVDLKASMFPLQLALSDKMGASTSTRILIRLPHRKTDGNTRDLDFVRSASLIVRVKLKARGFHALLWHELKHNQTDFPLQEEDAIFLAMGWEDMVLVLSQRNDDNKSLSKILSNLTNLPFVEKTQSLFIRHGIYPLEKSELKHQSVPVDFDKKQKFETRIRIPLPHQNEIDVQKAIKDVSNNQKIETTLVRVCGTHDMLIRWKAHGVVVDRFLDSLIASRAFQEHVLSASTVLQYDWWRQEFFAHFGTH